MTQWKKSAWGGAGLWFGVTAALILMPAAALSAQSGRSYGPGRIWWDAGKGDVLPWKETYDNPDGQVSILNRSGAVYTEDRSASVQNTDLPVGIVVRLLPRKNIALPSVPPNAAGSVGSSALRAESSRRHEN